MAETPRLPPWLAHLRDVLIGLATAGLITQAFLLRDTIRDLQSDMQNWRQTEWPLERKLLVTDHVQLEARMDINAANIEELENEVRALQ